MQKRILHLQENLEWFIDQDEDYVLIVDCSSTEVPYLTTILGSLDKTNSADVFLIFSDPIRDSVSYIDTLVARVTSLVSAINSDLPAERSPFPLPPPESSHAALAPAERLRLIIEYLVTLLPETGDHRFVLALLPSEMNNPAAYAELVTPLLPWQGLAKWMGRCRLLARDERQSRFLIPQLETHDLEGLLFFDNLDLSSERFVESLEKTALDETAPPEERMRALIQIAGLDYSYSRFEEAYKKWVVVYDHYLTQNNPMMCAFALCSAGDIWKRVGNLVEAKIKYQQGLALVQDQNSLAIALNLLSGVSEVCMLQGEWTEAEGYLNIGDQVASRLLQNDAKCDFLERLGIAARALGKLDVALQKLRACIDLSVSFRYWYRAESALLVLIDVFRSAGMESEVYKLEGELRIVQSEQNAALGAHP